MKKILIITGLLCYLIGFSQLKQLSNSYDVFIQDQTTQIVNLFLFLNEGTFTLTDTVDIDDVVFTVGAGHSITAGDIVCFQEVDRVQQATVLNVNINTITIDSPFEYAFTPAGACSYGTSNMNVNGSVTPQIFRVSPGRLRDGISWDITRILIIITDDAAMDDGKFGALPALTNGCVFREINHITKNIFNVKKNGDFRLQAYDLTYVDATLGPAGQYSLGVRRSFAGQDKSGVVLRLNSVTNDEFQMLVRDDLTGLVNFRIVVQGHFTD